MSSTDSKCETNWNFTNALTDNSFNCKESNNESERVVYVHPLDKRSTSSLSLRSLEMCTESLFSETGSDVYSSEDEFSYLASEKQHSCCARNKPVKKTRGSCNKLGFPPPLSSISGDKGVKMQSHREGGRLVIKALDFSSFKAEREKGTLTLCLAKRNEGVRVKNADDDDKDEKDCLWDDEWWSSNRCNGDESGSKGIPSLPFCVAIS